MATKTLKTKKTATPKTITTLRIDGPTAGNGHTKFTLLWFDPDYHMGPQQRGQCYNANIEEIERRLTQDGYRVHKIPYAPAGRKAVR